MQTTKSVTNSINQQSSPATRGGTQSPLRSIARAFLPSAAAILTLLLSGVSSLAGSATWKASPVSGDWFTVTNWTPATVPNGPADTATFASSIRTRPFIAFDAEVSGIVFNSGANAFTIENAPGTSPTLTISGAGITNNSGILQNFAFELAGAQILFLNNATAGSLTAFTTTNMTFGGASTADHATFTNNGNVTFANAATAGDATFTNNAVLLFLDDSTAGNGTFTNSGAGFINFRTGTPTAGNGTFMNPGGTVSGAGGGLIVFNAGTGGDATFINNGGAVSGALVGETLFNDTGDAGNATLISNGSPGGGEGGLIQFASSSTGGTAQIQVSGNGSLDISGHNAPGLTTGSVEGDGLVFLGARKLTVGANNLSTTFSGVIQNGGSSGGTGGSLAKTGTGTLTLSGANTYTGSTTVSAGTLLVSNGTGSGTGTGAVNVNAGTLGGRGIISGPLTIGTGNGPGATLAPAGGTTRQATLTSLSTLAFNADATYNYTLKAKANRSRADKVVAMGVTINSGATFAFQANVQGTLQAGLVLTVIDNSSASPINGTFGNLPDGAVLTASGNNFQASYEGGDGNDLTLTVQ